MSTTRTWRIVGRLALGLIVLSTAGFFVSAATEARAAPAVDAFAPSEVRAEAQPDATYDLSWWSADGGGGTATGGAYALVATLGEPDAGVATGGAYVLQGGFLAAPAGAAPSPGGERVYLPAILR